MTPRHHRSRQHLPVGRDATGPQQRPKHPNASPLNHVSRNLLVEGSQRGRRGVAVAARLAPTYPPGRARHLRPTVAGPSTSRPTLLAGLTSATEPNDSAQKHIEHQTVNRLSISGIRNSCRTRHTDSATDTTPHHHRYGLRPRFQLE